MTGRIKQYPISKEFKEAVEKFREESQERFDSIGGGRGSRVESGGIGGAEVVYHPDYPWIWAYVIFDLTGASSFAAIGSDKASPGGTLFLDLQRLEAEKIADFIKSLWTQRHAGGRPSGESEKKRQERLELADEYYERCKEYTDRGERPLTQEEFSDDRGISVSTLQRALREASQSRQSEK